MDGRRALLDHRTPHRARDGLSHRRCCASTGRVRRRRPTEGRATVSGSVEMTIQFPYKRSLGPVIGAFMTALTEKRIIGIRSGDRVIVPPLEWDPDTGGRLAHDFVDVGPAGTVESWSWVAHAVRAAPARPSVRLRADPLDGADTSLLHAVDAGSIDAMSHRHAGRAALEGATASATSPTSRRSCPAMSPSVPDDDGGPAEEPVDDDGLQRVDHLHAARHRRTRRAPSRPTTKGRFLGLQLPGVRAHLHGRPGYCPVDAVALGPRARGRPPAASARSPTTRSSRRCSTRARPRPSRSRACTSGSTTPT